MCCTFYGDTSIGTYSGTMRTEALRMKPKVSLVMVAFRSEYSVTKALTNSNTNHWYFRDELMISHPLVFLMSDATCLLPQDYGE